MMESKCHGCKNFIRYKFFDGQERVSCVYGILALHLIKKCSHFQAKPKEQSGDLEHKEGRQKSLPTVCAFGCGNFKDLIKHYRDNHQDDMY